MAADEGHKTRAEKDNQRHEVINLTESSGQVYSKVRQSPISLAFCMDNAQRLALLQRGLQRPDS